MDNNGFDPFGTSGTPQDRQDTQYGNSSSNQHNTQQGGNMDETGYYHYAYRSPAAKKKEKKKLSLGALIASCLVCAIIASGVTSAVVLTYAGGFAQSGSNGLSGTVINVDKTSTNAVSAIAQKVVPSVVGIRLTASVNNFFGFTQEASSEGSGVIYSSDGYIITNYHVVSSSQSSSAAKISVYLPDDPKTAIPAEIVGSNSNYDLAVLKIDKEGLNAVEFGASSKLEVGELAVAVGNPGGINYMSSVSSGIISGLDRTIQLESTTQMKVIQTDAAINPGNSGGALVNYKGELVGINSSKISNEAYEGMGFAIPSDTVAEICGAIIENKDKKYAYVGVTVSTDYSGELLESMGYPAGAVVESVAQGSPAAKVGITNADIITKFDGVGITDYSNYNEQRLKHSPGETVTLTVYRSGQYYDVSLTLGTSDN